LKLKPGVSKFWIHSVFFTLLNRSFLIAFGVVSYIILAKKVFPTAKEMGIWALFLTIFTVFENIKQGLLRNPMIKFLSDPDYVNNRNKVQSASLAMNILFSFIVIVLLVAGGKFFAGWLHAPELETLFKTGIFLILLLIPFNHLEVLLQAHFKFKAIFYGYLCRSGFFMLSILLLLLIDKPALTLIRLVWLQIISLVLGSGVLLFFAKDYLYRKMDFDRQTSRRMFHFGKYIFGTNVFSTLGKSADQFISAGLISAHVVAFYNVVSRINNLMDVPSIAIADVLFPKNVEVMAESGTDKVRYYFERMVGTIISIMLPISLLIFLFPQFFIMVIAGNKYLDAVSILQIVILFSILRPFSYQFGTTMDAIGHPKINFRVSIFTMVMNYGCMYIGLRHTWLGAAYGAVISSILSFIIMYILLNRIIGVRIAETVRWIWQSYRDFFRYLGNIFVKNVS
jgi:lipopolysaccharide exporter